MGRARGFCLPIALGLALAGGVSAAAQPAPERVSTPAPLGFDHAHSLWTEVLAKRVRDGLVDYSGLAADRAPLERYLASLETLTPAEYARFSELQKLAFWINAYNAYTLKLVLDHHPVASIKDIGSFLRGPFAQRFIPLTRLRGDTLALDDLEHAILRKEFREPRIHFAIVCASKSCPALRAEAYRADVLDAQLAAAARDFLADRTKNRVDPATGRVELSSIFKWFREDFEAAADGSLAAFVARHAPAPMAQALTHPEPAAIEFLDYDWALNGR